MSHPLVKISLQRRHAQTVNNGASSHKTNYIDIFFRYSKSWRTSKLLYWFRSYSNFSEWVDFPNDGASSGRVCALQPAQQACISLCLPNWYFWWLLCFCVTIYLRLGISIHFKILINKWKERMCLKPAPQLARNSNFSHILIIFERKKNLILVTNSSLFVLETSNKS